MFESTAIALYLTDKFPKNRLGPLVGDAQRGAYLSWLAYYSGVLEPAFMSKFMNFEVPRPTAGWVPLEESLATLVQRLTGGPYLLGERFSALDALYGTAFAQLAQLLPKTPPLEQYIERIVTRPAYARALTKEAR